MSSVEVVVAVRRRSAGYLHANLIVGAAVAFASLAVMLFAESSFGLLSILVDPFVVGGIAGALVELMPGVKRALTPPTVRRRHVDHAARATFVDRGVHNTTDRSGLLVYVSWLEQQIAVVADSGLARAVPPEVLAALQDELTGTIDQGGVAVARRLAARGPAFAEVMPRRADDRNELPDDIDEEPSRSRRRA